MGFKIGRGLGVIPLEITFDDPGHGMLEYGLQPIVVKLREWSRELAGGKGEETCWSAAQDRGERKTGSRNGETPSSQQSATLDVVAAPQA